MKKICKFNYSPFRRVLPILCYLYQPTEQIMQMKLKSVESCHNLIINWKFLQITTNKNDVSMHRLE